MTSAPLAVPVAFEVEKPGTTPGNVTLTPVGIPIRVSRITAGCVLPGSGTDVPNAVGKVSVTVIVAVPVTVPFDASIKTSWVATGEKTTEGAVKGCATPRTVVIFVVSPTVRRLPVEVKDATTIFPVVLQKLAPETFTRTLLSSSECGEGIFAGTEITTVLVPVRTAAVNPGAAIGAPKLSFATTVSAVGFAIGTLYVALMVPWTVALIVPNCVVNTIVPVGSANPQQAILASCSDATVYATCPKAVSDRAKNITAAIRIVFFIYNCSFAKRGEAIRLTGLQR